MCCSEIIYIIIYIYNCNYIYIYIIDDSKIDHMKHIIFGLVLYREGDVTSRPGSHAVFHHPLSFCALHGPWNSFTSQATLDFRPGLIWEAA
jgi:hypothetical protein